MSDDLARLQADLLRANARFDVTFHHAPIGMALASPNGTLLRVNLAYAALLGYEPHELIGRNIREVTHPDDWDDHASALTRAFDGFEDTYVLEKRYVHRDGREVSAVLHGARVDDPVLGSVLIGQVLDVTEARHHERAAAAAQAHLKALFEQAPIGMASVGGDGVIRQVNRAFARIVGYSEDELVGMTPREFTHPDDWADNAALLQTLLGQQVDSYQLEKRYMHKQGHTVWVSLSAAAVEQPDGSRYVVGQIEDITERRRTADRLAYEADHDALTGLFNRRRFLREVDAALHGAGRDLVAVAFVNLDRFKIINDSLGHEAGDEVLVRLSQRLRAEVREGEAVARYSGDEFALLLRGADEAALVRRVEGLVRVVANPIESIIGGLYVTASAGLAAAEDAERVSAADLIRRADTAANRAKERGRARIEVFDAAVEAAVKHRLETGNALYRALADGELCLVYQPLVGARNGELQGFEALVRWQHPQRGLVLPADFIPLAEDIGLIVPIGEWVLRTACEQAVRWELECARRGLPSPSVSVNLAARQLVEPDIADMVAATIDRSGIDPCKLHLEITESALVDDDGEAVRKLEELHRAGARLSIDDFGTGYSSLSYLHRLPVDTLKIDRAFVSGDDATGANARIVPAVVNLAHALELAVVAEGVETREQLAWLRGLNVDVAQGYYFGRPQPPEQFPDAPTQLAFALPHPAPRRDHRTPAAAD